ncbi:AAA family ATPase [Anabaena azotica]|uniref:AAA family ATPase n=1 Tax=Anabaena azotica TaxID=197653 RepID=UPI0039A787E8
MYIKKLQVFNYKSYFDSGVMEFTPGINIIVGKNNAGKTSLLEVLTLDFENQPHRILDFEKYPDRSLRTLPNNISGIKEESKIEITFYIASDEDNYLAIKKVFEENPDLSLIEVSVYQDYLEIKLSLKFDYKINEVVRNTTEVISHYTYETRDISQKMKLFSNNIDTFIYKFNILVSRIYKFKAERLNIGSCKFENNNQLKSDASNLAEVICILQGKNPGVFSQLNKLVSSILPEIKWISALPRDNSEVEIIVWTLDTQLNRDDLSLPLSSCGSGVSQVLAIVYILVSSIHESRTIIIDEPQSFLHPGAAKKLIETIKQFPQHQYFIATHSPDIITTADPSNIIKLQYQDCETTASVIDAKDIDLQKEILNELGIRLSDVFGADSILWVEGETEEKCYPLILEKILDKQLRGIKILAVQQTGDFEGTKANLVFDIYKKLSEGSNLFPPAIGFLFDSEGKSEEEKKIWQERSKKPVEFLSRRMYENYLLDPEAIAAVFNEENQSRQEPLSNITKVDVEEWLDKKQQEEGLSEEEWLYKVHASNILEQLFSNLSQRKIKFRKPKHSYELTKWLVENKPGFLSGLAEEIAKMLNCEDRSHRQP